MGLTRIRAEQISDIDYKQAVRAISTSNVTLSGGAPSTVDGVSLNAGDRILVAGQSTGSQNGLYDVTVVGAGSSGTWVRTSDANTTGEINAGMIVMVTEGNTYADTSWKLVTDDPIVIGTTSLEFLQNTGNSFSIINVVGSANVVANGVSSTVSFASGNNFSVTGNNTSDVITFSVSENPIFTTVSATGNISGNYILGNGSALTGLPISSQLANGTSNISILANSSIQMFVPNFNANIGAVNIVGTPNGNILAPQNPGVMLHLTGQTGIPARIYNDAVGNFAGFVGRAYNGNVNAPTQILANTIVSRFAATPYNSSGWPANSTTRIDMVTLEDQTNTNRGTEIQFWTTAVGTADLAKVMSVTNNDIKINGNLAATGNATFSTNIDYVNNITVSGTTYDAQIVIDDIGANNVAQLILTRSSTSVQPIIATALNNSDDPTANADVTNGQTLFQLASLGFAGTDYKEFSSITFYADDNGTISETSSPGKITFNVTPDGSTNTNQALVITNDSTATFSGVVNVGSDISASGNIYGGGVNSTSSPTPPSNPSVGDFWYNTTTNAQYRYTFDGTDYFWLDDYGSTQGTDGTFSQVINGTSNVSIYTSSGNVSVGVNGTSNVAVFATTGAYVTGLNIKNSNPPATSTSPGVAGQIEWSAGYIYVCTATNTWVRAALSTW